MVSRIWRTVISSILLERSWLAFLSAKDSFVLRMFSYAWLCCLLHFIFFFLINFLPISHFANFLCSLEESHTLAWETEDFKIGINVTVNIVNLTGPSITQETSLQACLWGIFWWVTWGGRMCLKCGQHQSMDSLTYCFGHEVRYFPLSVFIKHSHQHLLRLPRQ